MPKRAYFKYDPSLSKSLDGWTLVHNNRALTKRSMKIYYVKYILKTCTMACHGWQPKPKQALSDSKNMRIHYHPVNNEIIIVS